MTGISTERVNREYLTREELIRFQETQVKTRLEELIKDCFLFCCFTGLRFSDLCLLSTVNVIESDSGLQLSFRITKTKEPFILPLSKHAIFFLKKWFREGKGMPLFPVLNTPRREGTNNIKKEIASRNAYFNKILKELACRAEIEKNTSFHIARHTFATQMLSQGISIEVVGKLLGHEDLKSTQVYAKVVDRSMSEAMRKLDNSLFDFAS